MFDYKAYLVWPDGCSIGWNSVEEARDCLANLKRDQPLSRYSNPPCLIVNVKPRLDVNKAILDAYYKD